MTPGWIGPTALLFFSLSQASMAWAQQGGSTEPTEPAKAEDATNSPLDVSRLPVNLQRIQRQLRQTSVREERDGLNLRYLIDVYGQAPGIQFFTKQDNLQSGPVPYGAPTHHDIINAITPQEYRAPAADFSGIGRWLAGKAKDKSK